MESHSRGLRLRTAHPIRFPGTPSPKGTSFRDESVENSTAGYGKTSMREFYTVSAARFRNADRPACAPDPAWRAGHIRSFLWRQGIRDAFVIAGPVPFSPAKRSGETRFAMASGPQGTKCRHASSPFNRISIRCVRKIADPQAPALRRQKTSGPGIFAESRKAFRIRARPKGRPNDREPSGSKARAASVLSARPVTSAVSSHSENNAGRIPRPADTRPSPNRTAYPYRSRRARHNARRPASAPRTCGASSPPRAARARRSGGT